MKRKGKERKGPAAKKRKIGRGYRLDEFTVAEEVDQDPAKSSESVFNRKLEKLGIDGLLADVYRLHFNYDVDFLPDDPRSELIRALGYLEGRTPEAIVKAGEFILAENSATSQQRTSRSRAAAGLDPKYKLHHLWKAYDDLMQAKADALLASEMMAQKVSQDEMRDGNTNIKFLHVGQGDCTFIKTPGGRSIMIDCGTAGGIDQCGDPRVPKGFQAVVDHVRSLVDLWTTLDVLILSHPDKDHHNKFIETHAVIFSALGRVYYSNALEKYKDTGAETSAGIKTMCKASFRKRVRLTPDVRAMVNDQPAAAGKPQDAAGPKPKAVVTEWRDPHGALVVVDEPDCTIRILAGEVGLTTKNHNQGPARNTASLVTLIETFGKKILVLGDATAATERFLITKYRTNLLAGAIDILRCSHHGSAEDCNIAELADALQAKEVIVSAGMKVNAKHGLPALEVIRRYWAHTDSGAPDAKHNVWYWYMDPDRTRVSDDLYTSTRPEVTASRAAYKIKKLWITGSHGTLMRTFSRTA